MQRNPYKWNTPHEWGHYWFPKPLGLGLTVISLIITLAPVTDWLRFYPALMAFMLCLTLPEVLEVKIRSGLATASRTDYALWCPPRRAAPRRAALHARLCDAC